jgi:hypothetical protein
MAKHEDKTPFPERLDNDMRGKTTPEHWVSAQNCELTTTILDSVANGVFTVDAGWRITSYFAGVT